MTLLKFTKRGRPVDARSDPFTQLRVEQALTRQRLEGTKLAAQTMAANGVPLDVARRVLTKPEHRRTRQET